ncbi:hypothetical protein R1flu_020820 [Riccia fluitans]|uniref:Uncharacterized protein n=1 Tax=Riccia fluitans TaxID=41844 RepID=A0ABD1ZN29_9MARC
MWTCEISHSSKYLLEVQGTLPALRNASKSHSLPLGIRNVKLEAEFTILVGPKIPKTSAGPFGKSSSERQIELDWHAQLSLDLTDLYVRYLKSGPGNLERDIERKFSYALSREDLENAILGGP